MSRVRTVLGDVDAHALGVTNAHDHLFFASPAVPDPLDASGAARAEAEAFAAAGGTTIVQWTPRGLGRRRRRLAEIAAATGIVVVSATGRHRAVHYGPAEATRSVEAVAARFIADIVTPHQPSGLVKVGTGFHHLDTFERISLEAAARASHATGAPIAVHLELGTAGDLVVETLTELGIAPTSVILGHVGRNPEENAVLDLAAAGCFLCFDGPSRGNHQTDWRTPTLIESLVERGHLGQLLVGGDTTTSTARSVVQGPGMPNLLGRFARSIVQRCGEAAWRQVTVANPARAFTLGGVETPPSVMAAPAARRSG